LFARSTLISATTSASKPPLPCGWHPDGVWVGGTGVKVNVGGGEVKVSVNVAVGGADVRVNVAVGGTVVLVNVWVGVNVEEGGAFVFV